MGSVSFSVLGPLMGGHGSQAFLGCVHEAEGQTRPVVMVFLPDELIENAEVFRHVVAETDVAAQIDHVNVNGVRGIIKLDEGYARLVDFADAESLRGVYARARELGVKMTVPMGLALVAGACMGVHYAHELGLTETGKPLVHGGIRPETLLVGFNGVCKVTGYGAGTLAAALNKQRGAAASTRDAYTATEQHFGGHEAATVQSDVYALGAVLYEALTGKTPVAADVSDAEDRVQDELLNRPAVGLTDKLARIVMKAMRKRSSDRYPSALAMRDALLETGARASDLEVAGFMAQLFPPDFPSRAARQQLLAKAQTEVPAPAVVPLVSPVSDSAAPVIPTRRPSSPGTPAAPAPRPTPRARPVPTERDLEAAAAPRHQAAQGSGTLGWLALGLGAGAAVALGVYLVMTPPAPAAAPVRPKTPVRTPVTPEPAPPPPTPTPSPQQPVATPTPPPPVFAPPAAPKPTQISVSSSPALDILIDGNPAGRGTANLTVTPGSHTVRGKDKATGIDVTRQVNVAQGTTRNVSIDVGKGTLLVESPPACDVFVDGKKVGVTPLPPLEMYEGKHAVLVRHGKTEYKQAFVMKPNFEATLHVEFRAAGE